MLSVLAAIGSEGVASKRLGCTAAHQRAEAVMKLCRYYVLRNNVVEKVLRLLYRREKWLVVAAVRFLRTCLGLKDDFYNRYLVRLHASSAATGPFTPPSVHHAFIKQI